MISKETLCPIAFEPCLNKNTIWLKRVHPTQLEVINDRHQQHIICHQKIPDAKEKCKNELQITRRDALFVDAILRNQHKLVLSRIKTPVTSSQH